MQIIKTIPLLFLPYLLGAVLALEVSEDTSTITIRDGANTVLIYHKAEVLPPKGVDPVYKRSGFIHPLHTPDGSVVTSIHPADHVHHMGLWHAWVKTIHGSRNPDFWNLKNKTGTVRYKKTISLHNDPPEKGFTVLQEHVSMENGESPIVILQEQFKIVVRKEMEAYIIDHITVQKNITDLALDLPSYRYGGPLAYRGPAHWDKTNSQLLTSENKDRSNGHATRSRWCAFSGPTDQGSALVAILCHPKNHDAPQRMRIWPETDHNGAVFFNYVPIQEKPWKLVPQKTYTLRYRILVADSIIDKTRIESAWEKYAGE